MFQVLIACNNVRRGVFYNCKTKALAQETRSVRQDRERRKRNIELENSYMAEGIGYGYDFRYIKKYKPRRTFYG